MRRYNGSYSRQVLLAIESTRNYIDSHPTSRKSTEEFAAEAGISRNLLQRGFKKKYNKRIKDYQFDKRMEAACEMLIEGRFIKKEIASLCGYDRSNNFSSAFKKKFKVSPSEWQEMNQQP